MARTLTSHNTTETGKIITEPYYLIEMGFGTTLYYSTLKTITIESVTWSASRATKLNSLKTDSTGHQNGSLTIEDSDSIISVLILGEGCAGKSIKIYQAYGSPTANSDLILLCDGEMDESTIKTDSVSIKFFSLNTTRYSPNIYITKPDFNYVPPAGTVIKSGNITVTLRKAP